MANPSIRQGMPREREINGATIMFMIFTEDMMGKTIYHAHRVYSWGVDPEHGGTGMSEDKAIDDLLAKESNG